MSAEGFLAAAQERGAQTPVDSLRDRPEHSLLARLAEARCQRDYWTARVERLEREAQQ